MSTGAMLLGFAYLRLSNEEARGGESSSITNQRNIIRDYCAQNGIRLVREFVDDGWSGGNFDRPAFQEMMRQLEAGKANMVITKDLSRLGRDMRESSYYAEQFYPEHGIRYIAIGDHFDTEQENVMAPFQFAMNEVYLRDGSRKVREVLRNKRESGQYCACPPYGYRKDINDRNRLVPDDMTAPIVLRIFEQAAAGDSSRRIALDLNADGVIPPLKYRVLYRDAFSKEGAARASDQWNYTTIKRILKNQVYLGHTLLGKSRKVSVKSAKKAAVPPEHWAVTRDTHPPLIPQELFDRAQKNLGRGTRAHCAYPSVRRSIFSGIVFCAKCGHALCSCGTVYKGEREKYWYLSCTHQRRDIANRCDGIRIKYADLVEVIRQDLNHLLSLTEQQMQHLVEQACTHRSNPEQTGIRRAQQEKAKARIRTIDKMITKLYADNAEGRLDDARLSRMVHDLEQESSALQHTADTPMEGPLCEESPKEKYRRFLCVAQRYTHLEQLDREILLAFVDRIEIGPKVPENRTGNGEKRSAAYRQDIRIFYKFVGELQPERESSPDG